MKQQNQANNYVVCIKNEGYLASLEVRKLYQVLPDTQAIEHQLVRIIDESGEDYLYPMDFFAPIEVPSIARDAFAMSAV